jgi:hypothetical protein
VLGQVRLEANLGRPPSPPRKDALPSNPSFRWAYHSRVRVLKAFLHGAALASVIVVAVLLIGWFGEG